MFSQGTHDRSGYPMDEADYSMHIGYETYADEGWFCYRHRRA